MPSLSFHYDSAKAVVVISVATSIAVVKMTTWEGPCRRESVPPTPADDTLCNAPLERALHRHGSWPPLFPAANPLSFQPLWLRTVPAVYPLVCECEFAVAHACLGGGHRGTARVHKNKKGKDEKTMLKTGTDSKPDFADKTGSPTVRGRIPEAGMARLES